MLTGGKKYRIHLESQRNQSVLTVRSEPIVDKDVPLLTLVTGSDSILSITEALEQRQNSSRRRKYM